jgi:hypothetical protein
LGLAAITHVTAATPETAAALHAAQYTRSLQNTDGGFPDFGASSTASGTLDAVFALAAVGINASAVTNSGVGPDDYLATQAATYTTASGGAAKLTAGLAAMDIDPTNFASMDVLATMEATYNPGTGASGTDTYAQALFIIAEASLDRPVPPLAVTYLRSLQLPSGAWEYCCAFGADTNTTAVAVRALIAAGVPSSDADVAEAIAYLHAAQYTDGGFPYNPPFASDPNSTGVVIQAIVALGQDPGSGGPWDLGGGNHPLAYLRAQQNPANGAIQYFGSDNAFATYQGIPGLILSAFPEFQDFPPADADADGFADAPQQLHRGPANAAVTFDNCIGIANAAQVNTDGNFLDNSPPWSPGTDDKTRVRSDSLGDACDADDDNDGLTDAAEASGSSCGGTVTNPNLGDTDVDRVLDGAECALGTNPTLAASKPTAAQCGVSTDSDGDRLSDRTEFCGYNSNPNNIDSDGDRLLDGAADGCEAASIDGNLKVNSGDQLLMVLEIIREPSPALRLPNFDVDKDGTVSSGDQLLLAIFIAVPVPCP